VAITFVCAPRTKRGKKDARRSDLTLVRTLFYIHVLEFAGFKDLAALLTLDEFRILIPAHDLYAGMFARGLHVTILRRGR
jgi:hypothetical protein